MATLERYEWRSTREFGKRVSDWNRAAVCADCGSQIVHVYTVEGRDLGAECAWRKVGARSAASMKGWGKAWIERERTERFYREQAKARARAMMAAVPMDGYHESYVRDPGEYA